MTCLYNNYYYLCFILQNNYNLIIYNGHGDVVTIVNSDNEVFNTYEYDVWGVITNETGEFDNPYRYAGYYYDVETGNYYLLSRYYNPVIARFISEDTYRGELNDPLSLNKYVYVMNNPMIYTDPNGQAPIPLITSLLGGLYGGGSKIISNVISGNDWYKGVSGATIQGLTTGFGFGLCGTACGGIGGYVGNIAGQAVESYSATGKVSINQKEAFVSGITTTVAGTAFGFSGNYFGKGTQSLLAGIAGDVTYQFTNNGITTDEKGNINGYNINNAISNYNIKQTVTTAAISTILAPTAEKVNNWAIKTYGPQATWGNPDTLERHFDQHGKDFNSKDINDYTDKANKFHKNQDNYQVKVGKDGITRIYDPNTNTFGSYNPDGTTKTFYKPTSKNYWNNQQSK